MREPSRPSSPPPGASAARQLKLLGIAPCETCVISLCADAAVSDRKLPVYAYGGSSPSRPTKYESKSVGWTAETTSEDSSVDPVLGTPWIQELLTGTLEAAFLIASAIASAIRLSRSAVACW